MLYYEEARRSHERATAGCNPASVDEQLSFYSKKSTLYSSHQSFSARQCLALMYPANVDKTIGLFREIRVFVEIVVFLGKD